MVLTTSQWKAMSMVVFTLLSVIGFAIAVLLKERTNQLYVSSGVMFSAGVLLAGGLVHLLGDSTEGFDGLAADGKIGCNEECFPWSFAISGFTVVVLVCIEIMVRDVTIRELESSNNNSNNSSNSSNGNSNGNTGRRNRGGSGGGGGGDGINQNNGSVRFDAKMGCETRISSESYNAVGTVDTAIAATNTHEMICQDINLLIGNHDKNAVDPLTAIILTIALSIHVIIEGIGIGAMDDISAIRASFVGVAFHKSFTAYALANSLVSCGYWKNKAERKYFYASTGLFVGLTLVGIAVGWGVSTAMGDTEDSLGSSIVVAVTAGSFLYVSAFEIIPEEMSTIKRNRLQTPWIVVWFLLGYCLMTLLAIWA